MAERTISYWRRQGAPIRPRRPNDLAAIASWRRLPVTVQAHGFLLTDGRPSVGVTTNADEILEFVRERNASAGIVIHTIGLSGAQDAYLLRNLAEQNGGTYAAH